MEILQAALVTGVAIFGLSVSLFGLRFLLGNSQQYERNKRLSKSSLAAAKGNVVGDPGAPQHRIARGIAINRKTGRLTDQGRLSDESVHGAMVRPR